MEAENLGPAEKTIRSLLTYSDHLYHGRPGIVTPDRRTNVGVRWEPVVHKEENGTKTVYRLQGKRRVPMGTMNGDGCVRNAAAQVIGSYRKSGIFPEVAEWFYRQIAEVWELDNEFSARWASYAFGQEHRDLKVVLAAFMLVQSRKGEPVMEGGEFLFADEDYRDVGEAMALSFNPKMLLRVWEVLNVQGVIAVNRRLGFGHSDRRAFLGRWPRVVEKWLRYREDNPKMLEGLVQAGFRTTVMELARKIGYKPTSPKFFEVLRWKQKQADDGRRQLVIGKAVSKAESWEGLSESDICQTIVNTRPNWKRIVGLLPGGVTRAIMAAAIESGCLSNKDLVIVVPTLEELGLLEAFKDRVNAAIAAAEDMRAANIARNVRSKELKEQLEAGADKAAQKAVQEVARGLRVHVLVDISGSMQSAIEKAKPVIAKLIQALPKEQVHVATFNTMGREVTIKATSTAGVEAAFRGINAGGGTDYAAGVRALSKYPPKEGEDLLMIFIGDQQAPTFMREVQRCGLDPVAFGFLYVRGAFGNGRDAVEQTARSLGIPCFGIDERTFDDPYAVPRTIRNLVAATPVGAVTGRETLIDQILKTDLLEKPTWA